ETRRSLRQAPRLGASLAPAHRPRRRRRPAALVAGGANRCDRAGAAGLRRAARRTWPHDLPAPDGLRGPPRRRLRREPGRPAQRLWLAQPARPGRPGPEQPADLFLGRPAVPPPERAASIAHRWRLGQEPGEDPGKYGPPLPGAARRL